MTDGLGYINTGTSVEELAGAAIISNRFAYQSLTGS